MISEASKPGVKKPALDIVLCATQRCGSTLIVEDMRNSGILGKPEEYFIPWGNPKAKQDWQTPFRSVCKRATGDNGIASIKIMANQLPSLEACLATFTSGDVACEFPCVATIFADSHWVWLKREDIVAQAISRVMAQQTGINHATGDANDSHFAGNLLKGYTSDYNKSARYVFEAILAEIISITLENLCWQRFFQAASIQPLVFVYEQVINDSLMSHLDQLATLTQQDPLPNKSPRKMVKLSNKLNEEWEERFFADAAKRNFRLKSELKAIL